MFDLTTTLNADGFTTTDLSTHIQLVHLWDMLHAGTDIRNKQTVHHLGHTGVTFLRGDGSGSGAHLELHAYRKHESADAVTDGWPMAFTRDRGGWVSGIPPSFSRPAEPGKPTITAGRHPKRLATSQPGRADGSIQVRTDILIWTAPVGGE